MSCGGHGHGHDHDHEPAERGVEYSLYTKIDTVHVDCLNEAEEASAAGVFRPWDCRLDTDQVRKLTIN